MPWQKTVANASTLWIFVVRSLFSMEMLNTQNKRFATLVAPIIKRNTRRPLGAKHPHGRYVATWDGVLGDLIHAAWKPSAKLALLGLHWKHIFFLTSSRMPNPNLNCPLFWGAWTLPKTQNALRTKKTHKASFCVCLFFQNMLKPENEIPSLKNETSHQKGYVSNFKFQPSQPFSTISSFQHPTQPTIPAPPRWSPAPSSLNRTKAEVMTLGGLLFRVEGSPGSPYTHAGGDESWRIAAHPGKMSSTWIPRCFWTLQILHRACNCWKPHSQKAVVIHISWSKLSWAHPWYITVIVVLPNFTTPQTTVDLRKGETLKITCFFLDATTNRFSCTQKLVSWQGVSWQGAKSSTWQLIPKWSFFFQLTSKKNHEPCNAKQRYFKGPNYVASRYIKKMINFPKRGFL